MFPFERRQSSRVVNRVIRKTLLEFDESTPQTEKNASRGAGGVAGTCVLVSYCPLGQGSHELTTTG